MYFIAKQDAIEDISNKRGAGARYRATRIYVRFRLSKQSLGGAKAASWKEIKATMAKTIPRLGFL